MHLVHVATFLYAQFFQAMFMEMLDFKRENFTCFLLFSEAIFIYIFFLLVDATLKFIKLQNPSLTILWKCDIKLSRQRAEKYKV